MPPADTTQANQGQDASDGETAQQITEEQINAIVNRAVTAQLKRSLSKELGSAIAAALEPIKKDLAAPQPEPKPDTGDKPKTSPEVLALQKQLEDMRSSLRQKDEEATAERKRARDDKAYAEVIAELTGKVRPGTEKMVATLMRAEGRISVSDDGESLLKVRFSPTKGEAEQDQDLRVADAVPHYLKSKDAMVFLPPPSGGAGGDPNRVPSKGKQPPGQQPTRYTEPAVTTDEMDRRAAAALERLGVSVEDL